MSQRNFIFRPQARDTDVPWLSVQIEESAPGANAFALIDTRPLPVDLDPSSAEAVPIETFLATQNPGDYRLRSIDVNGVEGDWTPVLRLPSTAMYPWQPDVQEIAPLLRARLRASGATEFTNQSTPSLPDAERAVRDAVNDVLGLGDFPDRLNGTARSFVLYQAAAVLETSTYPGQTRTDQSPRPHWQTLADARWKTLSAGATTDPVDPGTGEPVEPGLPRWTHATRRPVSEREW